MTDDNSALKTMMHALIGCDWGRKVTAAVDLGLCTARAAQRVMIHDPATGKVAELRLCATHLDLIYRETDPHAKEGPDVSPEAP